MQRMFEALGVAITVTALAGGCVALTGRTAGETIDNKMTVASVKAKLSAQRLHNLTWVDVDANDGVVYLTGNAATPEEKARATEIAMRAKGVKRVVNDIVVNSERHVAAGRPAAAASSSSGASSTAPAAAPAASPTTTSSSSTAGSLTGEVVSVDPATGSVMLRLPDGKDAQLRLPPATVRNVRPGDRLSVSVSSVSR